MTATLAQRAAMRVAGLIALAAAAAAPPAQAAIMQAVFTGAVTLDVDGTGADMFGLQQANVLGQAFTMTFRYDTSLGDFGTFQDEAVREGGPFIGTTSPVLFANVTINGVTLGIPQPDFGNLSANDGSLGRPATECITADGPAVINLENAGEGPSLQACVQKAGFPLSLDFSTPFELHGGELSRVASQVLLFRTGEDGVHAIDELEFLGNATDVVVTQVPEPATWALMIVGVFGAGAAVRRRRAQAA